MGVLNVVTASTGLVGVMPRIVYINTDNTTAEVLVTGYLNKAVATGAYQFTNKDMALVYTTDGVQWMEIAITPGNTSLVAAVAPGTVVLPVTANHIASFVGTTGAIGDDPATAINGGNLQAGLSGTAGYLASFPATAARGSMRFVAANNAGDTLVTITNASHGQESAYTIPDSGAAAANFIMSEASGSQTIASGLSFVGGGTNIQITGGGNFIAGSSGAAGGFYSYPATAANGSLGLVAANAGADFATTISNDTSIGQDQLIIIPDCGAATAKILLDTGSANILAHQQFVGLSNVLSFSAGTWTTTRIALGNYGSVKSQADETAIIGIDVTPFIRTAAAKGFRLDSFDVMYGIATLALDAHSVTLSRVAYANNVAVSVTSIPITATLATATQANPYLTNAVVDTPAFDVTADSKYVIEVTVDAGATSDYTYYGVMLRFSQTVA